MKIKLIDGTIHNVDRAEIVDGRLEIDISDKTAEEVQALFSTPGNLSKIELLTDAEDLFGELPGWTTYGGVMLNGDTKTAILTKPVDQTEERIAAVETAALEAKTAAESQVAEIEQIKKEIAEGGTGVDQELFTASAVVARANAQALPDAQAIQAKSLYPTWNPNSVEYGVDFKVLHENILYRCISDHTSQADWAPGVAPSLWTAIESSKHSGTEDDPIPVPDTVTIAGMEYEKGKYYSESGRIYLMDRQGMRTGERVTLYFPPSGLVGQYFSLEEAE